MASASASANLLPLLVGRGNRKLAEWCLPVFDGLVVHNVEELRDAEDIATRAVLAAIPALMVQSSC
jgi:hypothetical protein